LEEYDREATILAIQEKGVWSEFEEYMDFVYHVNDLFGVPGAVDILDCVRTKEKYCVEQFWDITWESFVDHLKETHAKL
jgi:hypothetical protein